VPIQFTNLKCLSCGSSGKCDCWETCELCGSTFNRRESERCDHRVHQFDAEVGNAFRNGYWRVDTSSGRLYKTRAGSIHRIYQELMKGNVFFSRKEFNRLKKQLRND
jgi:RecJ-like exonuclease